MNDGTTMTLRDKEKILLVDILCKTAEYVLALIVLGSVVSATFRLTPFIVGLIIYFGLLAEAVYISSTIKD